MRKQKEIEEIKKLIQSGFDLKLISFELDIPMEELIQYKIDIQTSKINNAEDIAHSRINEMRERYKKLYFSSNKVEVSKPKPLSQEEIEVIERAIAAVEEKIKSIKTLSKNERKHAATFIFSELKNIEKYQLSIAQAERLYNLICSQELYLLNIYMGIEYYINNHRRNIANNYAKAIEIQQSDAYDIETLKALQKRITGEMIKENPISIESVKRKITNKILAIEQKNAIERVKNNIPTNIISIIQDLANGNIDIQSANAIIDEEAKKRVDSKTKTKFSLTEEQERRQILIQIRSALMEKADKFHIKNPESAIIKIQELCGGELVQAIRVVVKNLIGRRDFETAQSICNKYYKTSKYGEKESEFNKYIRGLKNEIRNAQIGDIVMNLINMNGTPEEEKEYFLTIEKGIKMGNVNLRAVFLGKSEDGAKDITLADIWDDKKTKTK